MTIKSGTWLFLATVTYGVTVKKTELQLFCAVTQFIKPGTGHDGHF